MAPSIGFEKYIRWPLKKKAILWGGIAVLILAVYYSVWFSAKRQEIAKLQQESSVLAGQIVEKKAIADNLESVKQAVAQMDILLKQALEKLPSGEEIPKLLMTVSDLARETGLEALLFKPGATTPVEPEYFYASIPLDMEQTGNFYDLARFFDKISRLPRIVTIENISVNSVDGSKTEHPKLKAVFKAVTFKYLLPEERPKKEAPKAAKPAASKGKAEPGGKE